MGDDKEQRPEILLPYVDWMESAMRQVVVQAMAHIAAHGFPGEHHFYIEFRTDHEGVVLPEWLRKQYPTTMRIHLRHNYINLLADPASEQFSVGLTFSGVPCTLVVPYAAVTEFTDPFAGLAFQFRPAEAAQPEPAPEPEPPQAEAADQESTPQVVSLDAFRRRTSSKE